MLWFSFENMCLSDAQPYVLAAEAGADADLVNVWSPATDGTAVLLLIPIALVVCGLLSTRCARRVFWPLVEPPTDRLLFASAPAPGGGGRGQPSLFAVRSEVNLAPV